ncbi:related to gEgh 16 protein [Cephalotrichum gorgonifer]|uniref:Related to gEgh 16 protein n=1 Tax=Cephalotrichum gorgonifer TaxID=2041049 RepID=A0AAE8N7R7_9PEZI|nr:related to gEgh 16 protein [Cephalotrichum gorgonifer]
MLYHVTFIATLATLASSHGVVTSIQGANGVVMPGLSIADGTPRDCSSNRCGSQADTSIIRDREMSENGPLGRTQGNGPVLAETMISNFMGTGSAPTNNGANDSVGVEDDIPQNNQKRGIREKRQLRNLLGGLFGGGGGGGGSGGGNGGGGATGLGGLLGGGGDSNDGPPEASVAQSAGAGQSDGLPTCSDDGTISLTYRQINQDGAGPLDAAVDGTSGGTDPDAFQNAEVTQDVPGLGIQGLSLATNTDFPVEVQMPAGMTCDATVAGVDNVCIVRVRNGAAAGPFGGSAAFTQSAASRKRAIAYRLKKRMEIGNRK